jgi:hypothetical protein
MELQCVVSRTDLKSEPLETSRLKIEILFGERIRVLESEGPWSRAVTVLGEYEGYVRTAHFGEPYPPTHRVNERVAVLYNEPNFKNPTSVEPLYFNALVHVEESKETPEGGMHRLRYAGWVFDSQLKPVEYRAPDFLEECLKFLGSPYGYERRGALIDCSTLVQAGCIAAGIDCPYDVKTGDMAKLGEPVRFTEDFSNLERGDLVFWTQDKGSHVVVMLDRENCLHATIAHPYRKALIQPLAQVMIDQARDNNGPVTQVRRFPDYRRT